VVIYQSRICKSCFLIYECGYLPRRIRKSKTPKTPAHLEEYTNAAISNNRIRKIAFTNAAL